MSDHCNVVIFFIYSIQKREDTKLTTEILQEHGFSYKVELDNVPSALISGEKIGRDVLFQAEHAFMGMMAQQHPDADVIRWESRLRTQEGIRLSTYNILATDKIRSY